MAAEPVPSDLNNIKRLLQEAKVAARSKVFSKALRCYDDALQACEALDDACGTVELQFQAQLGLAQVYCKQGRYSASLDHCLFAMETCPEDSPAAAPAQLLAAKCALHTGFPEQAMAYITIYIRHKPQDSEAQVIMKDCNIELEYDEQVKALAAGEECSCSGRITSLLDGLKSSDKADTVESLMQLSRVTSSSCAAQIVFSMHQGFEVIMLHFKEGSFNAVASVLVAAGTCKVSASTPSMKAKGVLPTPKSAKQKRIFDSAAMAAALVAAAADNVEGRSGLLSGGSCGLDNSVRVRWSYKVLAQLASTAESEASSPAIVECALQLLAYCSRDAFHRQIGLTVAPPAEPTMPELNGGLEGTIPEGDEENAEEESPKKKDLEGPDSALPGTSALAALVGKTQSLSTTADLSTPGAKPTVAIVNRLLATVDKAAGWLDQLPAYGLLALSRLFQSLASDKHSRQLLPAAGKPITLLVKMYRSIKHKGPPEAVQEAQGQGRPSHFSRPPCCAAAHSIVTTLLVLCSLDPHLLTAEGFAEKVPNVRRTAATAGTQRHMPAAAGKLLPTPLLGSMAKELKELMKSSPTFEMPDLAWDGDASTVMEGKVAADPCSLPPATCTSSTPHQQHHQQAHLTLVELWIHTLASAACCGGMTAAKELYRVDATMLAKVASNLFRTSPGVLAAAERLYCAVGNNCPAAGLELCKSGIVPGLLGISLGGTNGNPPPPPAPTPAVREGDTNAYKGAGTSKDADTSKDTDASKGAVASTGADASKGAGSALAAAQARAVAGRMDSSRSGIPNSIKALTAGVGVDADLALKAMDRLATVLDDCNGHDFMRIIRQGGVLAAAYELLTNRQRPSTPAGRGKGGRSGVDDADALTPGTWAAAVQAVNPEPRVRVMSALGGNPGLKRNGSAAVGKGKDGMMTVLREQQAFWDASRVLALGCLERSRRMSQLKSHQAPTLGFWGVLSPPELLNMERLLRQQWCDMMLPTPNLAAQSAVSRAHSAAQSAFNSTGQGPGYDLMRTGGYPGTPSSRGGLAASSIRPRTPFMATNELPPSLMPAPLSGRQKKKAAGGEEASSAYREAEPHVNSSGAAVAMSAALGAEVVMERERAAAKNMDDLARSLVRGPPGPSRPSTSQQHEGLHNINNNHINQAGLQRSMNSCRSNRVDYPSASRPGTALRPGTPGHLLDPLGQTAPRSLPLFGTKLASLKPRAPTSELEEQTTASASSHLGGTMKDRASDSGVESQPSASAGSHLGGTIKHRASATGEEGQPSASASSHLGGTIKHRASATGAEGHPAGSSADGYCSTMKHRTSASGAEGHPAGSSADGYCSTMKHRTSASGAEGQPGGSFAEDVFGTMKSRRSLSGQGVLEGLGSIRKTMRSLNGQELLEGVASAVTSRRSLSGQGVPEGLGSTRKTRRSLNGQGLPEGTLTASTMTNRPSLTGQEEQLAASEPKRRSSTGGGEPLLGVGNGFGSTLKSRKFGTGPVMLPAEESAIDLEELLVLDGLGTLKDRDTDGPDGLKDRITDGPDGLKDRDTDGPDALKDRDTDGPDGMKDRDTDAGSCYSSDDDFQSPPHKPAAAGSRPNQTLTSDSKETPNSDRNQTPDSDPNQHSPDSHPNQQNTGSDLYQTPKYVPNDKPVHTPLSGHLAELTGIEQPVHTPLSEGLYGLTGILPPPGEVSLTRLAIAGSRPGTALTSKASYSMSDFPPMENLSAGALHSPAVSSATPDEKVVRPPIASAERPRTSSRPAIRPKSGLARSHLITTTSPTTTTTTTTSRPTTSQARSGAGRSPPPSRQISPRGSNSRPSSQESARGEKSRPSSSQSSGQKRSSTPGEGLRTSHGTPPPATAHKRSSTPGEGPSSSPGTPAPATSQKHSTSFGEVPFLEDGPLSTLNLAIPLVARHSQEGSTHEGSAAAPGIGAAHRSQGGSSHEGSAAAAGISAAHRSQEGSTRDGSATAATSPGNKTATDTNSACRPLSAAAAGTKAPVPRPKAPPARSRPSTALPVTRAKRGGAPSAKPYRHLRPPTGGRALTIAELISPAIKEGLSLLEIQAVDRPTQGLVTPRGVDMGDGGGEEVEGDDGVRVEGGDGGDEVEDDEGVRVEGGGDEVEGDEGDVRQTILEESFLGDLPKDELSGEKEVKEEKEEEEKEEEGFTSLMDELGSTYNGTPFDAAHVPDHTLGKMAKALGLSGPADVPTGTIGTLIIALGETGGPPANETLGALITDLKQSGLGSEADTERGDSDGDSTADEVEKAEEGEDDDQYSDYDVQEEEKLKEEEMERVVTLGRPVVIITQGSNGGGVISQGSIRMGEAFKGDQCVLDALQLGAVLTADEEAKYGTADPLVSSTSHATRAASASSTAHAAGAAVASSTSHAPVEELKEEEEDEEGVITLGRPLVIITQGSNGGGVISQGSTRMGEAFEGDQCVLDALQLGAVLTAGEEAKYGTADPLASSTSHATGTSDPLASSTSHATGTADPLASSTSHATGAVGSDSQSAAAPEGTGNMSQPNSQSGSSPGSPVPADSSPESHQSSPPPPRRTPPPDHHHPTQDCLHHQTPTTPPKTAFSPEPLSSPEDAAPTSLGADTVTTTSSLPTSAKQGHSRPGPASSSASKAPSLNSNPTRTPTESQQNPNNTPTSTPTRIPTEPQQNPNSTPTSTPTRTAGIRPHLAPSDTHSPKGSLPSPTSGRPPSAARFLSSTILTQSLRVQPQDKEYNVGLMDGAHQPNQGMQQSLRSRPISSGSVLNHSLSHRSLLNRPPSPAFADIAAGLPVAYLGSEINCPLPRGREKLVLPPISRVSAASATSAEDSPPAQRDSPLLYSFHERDCDRKSSHSREAAARGGDSAAGLRSSSAGSASGQGGGGPGGSTSSPPAVSRPHWSAGGLSSSMNMLRTAGPQGAEARGLGDGLKAGGGGLGVHKVRRSSMMAGAGSKEPGSGRLLATAAPAVGQSTNFALDYSDDFEDDTLHDEWGANAEVQQARSVWKSLSLGEQIKWSQTSSDVMVEILLPRGTTKNEVSVDVQPDRVSVTLSWYGSVVEGPIPYEVNTEEVLWTVDTTGKQRKFDALHILMPKVEEQQWPCLFLASEE